MISLKKTLLIGTFALSQSAFAMEPAHARLQADTTPVEAAAIHTATGGGTTSIAANYAALQLQLFNILNTPKTAANTTTIGVTTVPAAVTLTANSTLEEMLNHLATATCIAIAP